MAGSSPNAAGHRPALEPRRIPSTTLTVIASREDLILGQLKWRERADLARCYLRFQVDTPVVVDVAVPAEISPFLDRPTRVSSQRTSAQELRYLVEALSEDVSSRGGSDWESMVSIERRSAHYVVFVQIGADGTPSLSGQPVVELDTRQFAARGRSHGARPGVSAAHDDHKPFRIAAR